MRGRRARYSQEVWCQAFEITCLPWGGRTPPRWRVIFSSQFPLRSGPPSRTFIPRPRASEAAISSPVRPPNPLVGRPIPRVFPGTGQPAMSSQGGGHREESRPGSPGPSTILLTTHYYIIVVPPGRQKWGQIVIRLDGERYVYICEKRRCRTLPGGCRTLGDWSLALDVVVDLPHHLGGLGLVDFCVVHVGT